MHNIWRKIIRKFHPEGIPSLGSKLYNFLTSSDIFQKHYNLVAQDIKKYCQTGKLLDIGTGPGWLLLSIRKVLPHIQLSGIDISPSMIEKAKENIYKTHNYNDIELLIGSASELPYPDNSIDCIVSTGSIHHWKEIQKGLTEIHRVLKNNSYALIYDLVQNLPKDIIKQNKKEFGKYKMILLWLHSFEEPFYSVKEIELLPTSTPFQKGDIHFTGALCCLVLKKV